MKSEAIFYLCVAGYLGLGLLFWAVFGLCNRRDGMNGDGQSAKQGADAPLVNGNQPIAEIGHNALK